MSNELRLVAFAETSLRLLIAASVLYSISAPPSAFAQSRQKPTDWRNAPIEGVYGQDNRIDWYQVDDDKAKAVGKASVAIFSNKLFSGLGTYTQQKVAIRSHGESAKLKGSNNQDLLLCSGERFFHQQAGASCSGVLVAQDLVVTAGHCFRELNDNGGVSLSEARFVFGHVTTDASDTGAKYFTYRQIYSAKEIVDGVLTDPLQQFVKRAKNNQIERQAVAPGAEEEDWATVRLNRPVPKEVAVPVAIRKRKIEAQDSLVAIGYPNGLPRKYTSGGKVRQNNASQYFMTNLDTFRGNSGSGVFLQSTHELVGILVRGGADYVEDKARNCARTAVCGEYDCSGEAVTRIERVVFR